tara:strand:- start:277 stop:471 length:195 start_codon:yes stop_codon:yes gene_type:complete
MNKHKKEIIFVNLTLINSQKDKQEIKAKKKIKYSSLKNNINKLIVPAKISALINLSFNIFIIEN